MFCPNCGKELPDGADFCPSCGKPVEGSGANTVHEAFEKASAAAETLAGQAMDAVNSAGQSIDSAVQDAANDLRGTVPSGSPLKTDRSLVAYILLSIITCGIYGYYFIYTVARDINIACDDDDEETAGLGMFILLSFITCGFYGLWWEYKLGNRLQKNGPAYGLDIQENGTTILLWRILGSLICAVGTFIGSYLLIKNVNLICDAYNKKTFGNAIVTS